VRPIRFDAGYNRTGSIEIVKLGVCDGCRSRGPVIATDSSEGEYGCGFICKMCADELFREVD